jgi:signal transduction histidine kinase
VAGWRSDMTGIRRRLSLSFIFIIVLTVIILEILILNMLKQNYYSNLEDTLTSQLKVSASIYSRYFSDNTLYDNILNNVDSFWNQSDVQVQIIDTNGKVLMDSIGVIQEEGQKMPDVEKALTDGRGSWVGKVSYDNEGVMAVSCLLTSQDSVVGVLRFVTSLKPIKEDINNITLLLIFIGFIAAIISVFVSLLIANTVVGPLQDVTRIAERMANGDFKIHSKKRFDDEIGKLSDTLNYMAGEIVKREGLKNDFISSVSHELRTPLTSIKGWAATLSEDESTDRELLKEGLGIIEQESDRLTAMVDELLDFSRFVSDRVEMDKTRVDIEEIMRHIGRQLAPRAEREGLNFQVSVQEGLPCLETDPNRLKQVFINILDNAFKFNRIGGMVQFMAVAGDEEIIFKISDTGCGIDQAELPNIKEKFIKGRHSKAGNGIGLSICDEIVRLMGGTLVINSVVNIGTEVVIRLPVPDPTEAE